MSSTAWAGRSRFHRTRRAAERVKTIAAEISGITSEVCAAKKDGKPWVGQFGHDITVEQGKLAARAVAIDLMATLQAACDGDLTRITRIVKVTSLVNSTADFTEQHLVTNGASELLAEVFGEQGKHARSAFGVAQLPLGACIEIELIAEVY